MRTLIRIAIFFYVFVIFTIGLSVMMLLARLTDVRYYHEFIQFLVDDAGAGLTGGLMATAVMLTSYALAKIIYGRQQKERSITFDNPLGKVSISTDALEDLLRRLTEVLPQIKEIRPEISAAKKGLNVDVRLTLRSDVNIPDLTAELQEMIKVRVQDVIGKEEKINIMVHVAKIQPEQKQVARDVKDHSGGPQPYFHGYRA